MKVESISQPSTGTRTLRFFREDSVEGAQAKTDQQNSKVTTKSVICDLQLEYMPEGGIEAASAIGRRHAPERVALMLIGREGSNPDISTIPIILYQRTRGDFPFECTSTISTPASIHAFERATVSFVEALKTNPASAKYDESQGQAIQRATVKAVTQQFGLLIKDVTWARRLNGPIQAATFLAFFALMLQLACRLLMNYIFEWRIRSSERLRFLWENPEVDVSTKRSRLQEWLRRVRSLLGRGQQARRERAALPSGTPLHRNELRSLAEGLKALSDRVGVRTGHRSAYLDVFSSAADAYLVSSDYQAVPAFVESKGSEILDRRSASQGFVKFLIWSIPTIGFIGTVVGIGDALSETVNVDSIDKAVAAVAKSEVSSNIGVAFDTTLVALVLSLIGMLSFHLLTQLEELVVLKAKADTQAQFIRPGEKEPSGLLNEILVDQITKYDESVKQLRALIAVSTKQFRVILQSIENTSKNMGTIVGAVRASSRTLDQSVGQLRTSLEDNVEPTGLGRRHVLLLVCGIALAIGAIALFAILRDQGVLIFRWPGRSR